MPKEWEIDNAIRYALRVEPPTEVQGDEDGEYTVELSELSSVKLFVMAVLRDLKVVE